MQFDQLLGQQRARGDGDTGNDHLGRANNTVQQGDHQQTDDDGQHNGGDGGTFLGLHVFPF